MLLRFIIFFGFLSVGAGLGWTLLGARHPLDTVLAGALVGALVWFVWDALRGARLMRWLASGIHDDSHPKGALWGELSERIRRLLRSKDQAIRERELRLQDFLSAFQASPNGVVLLDAQLHIEWCNQTAATHFGLDPARDLQQTIGNLVRDPGFAAYLSSRRFAQELLMPGRDNTPSRPLRLSVQLYPYGDGRLLMLSRDVTAIEQAEAMRRDFVANVSHEIRTPLTVLAGFVETLQTLALDDAEREQYLSLMAQQSARMQSLVVDLLMLSKLEGSPAPSLDVWNPMPTMLQQLEQDARALSQVINSDDKSHRLDCRCDSALEIAGIAQELHSAMSNLVSNAIRYTPPAGRIDISLTALPQGQAVFEVRDTGPGIAAEHLPRLTERFYRVDRSRSRETGGTGLGLAIVKHVAQRHGATLTIDSTPGKGSCFRIVFPAARVRLGV